MSEPSDDTAHSAGIKNTKDTNLWTLERALTDLSITTRRRFVKDFSLPISVLPNPYFEYYIELYDPLLHTKRKLQYLVDALNHFGGDENRFISHQATLSGTIMESIKQTTGYQKIQDNKSVDDMARFQQQHAETKSRLGSGLGGNLYSRDNDGKYFISLDLVTANFNALRFYDPSILLNASNWHELLSRFTNLDYYKHSKYFRQIVFGLLNPKKQATITKFITSEVFRALLVNDDGSGALKLCYYSADELVFHCSRTASADSPAAIRTVLEQDAAMIRNALQKEVPAFAPFIRIEVFRLKRVDPSKAYYVKEDIDFDKCSADTIAISDIHFKCAPSSVFAQVYRRYIGEPIGTYDRKVNFEGMVATLDCSIFENNNNDDDDHATDS